MNARLRAITALLIACIAALPLGAQAAAAPIVEDELRYTDADLDRMLAPIALYPDTVLTHVLIASTYPLEVVEAARWSKQHSGLRGQQAVDAVADRDWDTSVKALVAFPELLERMSEDLDWTEDLGNAFLAQEDQVMDRVQVLRDHADEAGTLDDVENVRVVREAEVIHIEPVREVVYVPYYDTRVVYGAWWWPAYPPVYWAYWGGYPYSWYHTHYHTTFYWGVGWYRPYPWFWYCAPHWQSRRVVTVNHYHRHNNHYYGSSREVSSHREARHWQHDSRHRHNVAYRQERIAREHGGAYRGQSYRGDSPAAHDRGPRNERRDQRREQTAGARSEGRDGGNRRVWSERNERPGRNVDRTRGGQFESQRTLRSDRPARDERPAQDARPARNDRRAIERPARVERPQNEPQRNDRHEGWRQERNPHSGAAPVERQAVERRVIERPARSAERSETPQHERRGHENRGQERSEHRERGPESRGNNRNRHESRGRAGRVRER